MEKIYPALTLLLTNLIKLNSHLHLAHWGVRGMFAPSFHTLYGDIYSTIGEIIDKLAEVSAASGLVINAEVFSEPPQELTQSDPKYLTEITLNILDDTRDCLLEVLQSCEKTCAVKILCEEILVDLTRIYFLLESSV